MQSFDTTTSLSTWKQQNPFTTIDAMTPIVQGGYAIAYHFDNDRKQHDNLKFNLSCFILSVIYDEANNTNPNYLMRNNLTVMDAYNLIKKNEGLLKNTVKANTDNINNKLKKQINNTNKYIDSKLTPKLALTVQTMHDKDKSAANQLSKILQNINNGTNDIIKEINREHQNWVENENKQSLNSDLIKRTEQNLTQLKNHNQNNKRMTDKIESITEEIKKIKN